MAWHSVSTAYLRQAEDLRENPGQLRAYDSKGHCVVLAGPGSGKTKTLVLKLARILAEDVKAPRGAACITYSQECARELSRRLEALGLRESDNLFIGTVHGFCLRHIIVPYGHLAGLALPYPLTLATTRQAKQIETRTGETLFGVKHPHKAMDLGRHRRSVLDRASPEWTAEPELAAWAARYETELHAVGLIDFDDLIIHGYRLIAEHDWVLPLLQAKFPVLVVDEYQDLGVALHRIVTRLAFEGGVRLFAVGDYDQTVYGFTGAEGILLQQLAARTDVERVQLQLNYRSAARLIRASELALGEERGYRSNRPDRPAVIDFVLRPGGLAAQAAYAVEHIIPKALAAKPGRQLGDIAVLYRDFNGGNVMAEAAKNGDLPFVRVDTAAPYKKCALTSWIEDCASWCAGGWREGRPQLGGLIDRWIGFHYSSASDRAARDKGAGLTEFLWEARRDDAQAGAFVIGLKQALLDDLLAAEPMLADQREQVDKLVAALSPGGALADFQLRELGKQDGSPDHLNLLTLHSSKGCEYDVVIMIGLDHGALPWLNETPKELSASRRLFYVGLTRARDDVHMLYSGWVQTPYKFISKGRSPFVDELDARLRAAEGIVE